MSTSNSSPKGNCWVRRLLVQCAWAAVKTNGGYFQSLFRRWVPRLGKQKAIWAVANKLLRIVWRILHLGESYIERGPVGHNLDSLKRRFNRLSKDLAKHGYTAQLTHPQLSA